MATIDQLAPFQSSANVSLPALVENRPTATHVVALEQETPVSSEVCAPASFGLATTDQLVPFQASVNVLFSACDKDPPTAKQLVAAEHETACKPDAAVSVPFGLVTIDQLVPFQLSTNVLLAELLPETPTATQLVAAEHDTPSSSDPPVPVRLGLVTIDQLVPFQLSTNVVGAELGPE